MHAATIMEEPVNILLVDDQPGKLLSYEAILGDLGENLIKANSGREALATLLATDIPVVLMDVSMPELDGFALAEIIRQHPRFRETAIIFVSAVHLTDVDRLKAYETGAVDYVSVPIVPELLRAKVRIFTDLYRRTREATRLKTELETRVAIRTAELEAAVAQQTALTEMLRQADRRKDEFLALLAHELRNPLAPIANAVKIMDAKSLEDPDLVWCRGVIERQVRQMTRLVDDLLDVSRLTLGKIKLRPVSIDLRQVVEAALEVCRPALDQHRHRLFVDLPPEPLLVEADEARLVQVVGNLLNNAVKYQDDGGSVAISMERDGEEAVVRVTDQGIGIPEEMLPKVFGLFVQGVPMPDRVSSGLGVGLSLVKTVVELHGGRVQVASAGPGTGSTFTVRIPAAKTSAAALEPAPAEKTGNGNHWCVLVLDDNVDAAQGLSMLLQYDGHTVHMAHDGKAALEIVRREKPDIMLVDLGLPGMDGCEFCRQARKAGADEAVIIAVTGYGQDQDRARTTAAGFDGHLVKPLDFDALIRLIEATIQPGRERMALEKRATVKDPVTADGRGSDG